MTGRNEKYYEDQNKFCDEFEQQQLENADVYEFDSIDRSDIENNLRISWFLLTNKQLNDQGSRTKRTHLSEIIYISSCTVLEKLRCR